MPKTQVWLIVASAVLVMAGAAVAQDEGPTAPDPFETEYTPAFKACMDAPSGESTLGMIMCIGEEVRVQDSRLNAAYAKAMAGLNARQKAKLRTAQRAWIAFRDADCIALQDEDWGSLSRIESNWCVLTRTIERTQVLERSPWGEAP